MEKFTKRRKVVEGQPIPVGVEARAEACGDKTQKRGLYTQGRHYICPHYNPPKRKQKFWRNLTMAWEGVFRDCGRYLNQSNCPLPSRDNVAEFDFWTNAEEFDKKIKTTGMTQ